MPATLPNATPNAAPNGYRRAATLAVAAAALAAGAYACGDDATAPGQRRVYGAPVALGAGHARTYVVVDDAGGGAPSEVGVAFDEAALQNLPAPMAMPMPAGGSAHEHVDMHEYLLPLPAENPTPYKTVELDWNPAGHEIEGIYTVPHFDFHFYTITLAERNAIDPADPQFQARANRLPDERLVPAPYSTFTPPGAPVPAVPRMGVHWVDPRSPELQGALGHPEKARPFTTTFIHGSWDGKFIFDEPMVTRAFILGRKTAAAAAQRDSVIPLAPAAAYAAPGYHPAAYRVQYDAASREYRVALTQLARHN